jgi:hypothetical protein
MLHKFVVTAVEHGQLAVRKVCGTPRQGSEVFRQLVMAAQDYFAYRKAELQKVQP